MRRKAGLGPVARFSLALGGVLACTAIALAAGTAYLIDRYVQSDTAVINRGVAHSVRTEGGAQFVEALAPVPLDHVPDRERDLVLGPDGGSGHVAK